MMTDKLWLDDVRPAPDGWMWAKTVAEAQDILKMGCINTCSLDHDLGADPADGINAKGDSPEGSGLDLARWMIENKLVPRWVVVHSWNPAGAKNIVDVLHDAGYRCIYRPYFVP